MNNLFINLGSGHKKLKGYINVDINPETQPNVCMDCYEYLKTLPTNSVFMVYSSHYLEHIEPQHYLPFLEELHRVTKPAGEWDFVLPFANYSNLWSNPLHYRAYSFNHFKSFYVGGRDNYTKITLLPEYKEPPILIQLFFQLVPFLKREIKFKLKVVKCR